MNQEVPQKQENKKTLDAGFALTYVAQFIALWEDRRAGDKALNKMYPDTNKM